MAVITKTAVLARNDMVDALLAYMGDAAALIVYEGNTGGVPATADTALTDQTALVTFALPTPSGTVADDVFTAGVIADAVCAHTGTAAFFRMYKTDGTTVVWQGTVGTADADMVLNSVSLVSGATVSITALTYTLPA